MTTMREEVDNLALRLFYLNNAKGEVKSDITIMRRAAEKASNELQRVGFGFASLSVLLLPTCVNFWGL